MANVKVFSQVGWVAYMIYHLMRKSPIILQKVVVLRPDCCCDFLCSRQYLSELVVRDVCQFGAVVFGYNELYRSKSTSSHQWAVQKALSWNQGNR